MSSPKKCPRAARNGVLRIQATVRRLEDFPEIRRLRGVGAEGERCLPPLAQDPMCFATVLRRADRS